MHISSPTSSNISYLRSQWYLPLIQTDNIYVFIYVSLLSLCGLWEFRVDTVFATCSMVEKQNIINTPRNFFIPLSSEDPTLKGNLIRYETLISNFFVLLKNVTMLYTLFVCLLSLCLYELSILFHIVLGYLLLLMYNIPHFLCCWW